MRRGFVGKAGFGGTQLWSPRILLIGTHADLGGVTSLRRNGRGETELVDNASLITSLQTSFGGELIIVPRVYVVNATVAAGADMKALRTIIGDMKQLLCQVLPLYRFPTYAVQALSSSMVLQPQRTKETANIPFATFRKTTAVFRRQKYL